MASRVAVVIINYNSSEYIGDCLSSLKKITYPSANLTLVVVDNASIDNSLVIVRERFPQAVILKNSKNLGFAEGNNVGMRYALQHDFAYMYLLNQDTEVSPDFLTAAVEVANRHPDAAAIQSKLLLFADKTRVNSIGNEIHYLGFAFAGGHTTADRPLPVSEITYPSGAAVLLRAEALRQVGLFDADFFMYHEDVDLGWRFWLEGWRVLRAPDSVVYHKYQFSRSISKWYYMERNRYLTIFQNYKIGTLLLLGPALLGLAVAMACYSLYAGWFRELARVYGYFLRPATWRNVVAKRRQIQARRRISDRAITQRFVSRIDFQDVDSYLVRNVLNPATSLYWRAVKPLLHW